MILVVFNGVKDVVFLAKPKVDIGVAVQLAMQPGGSAFLSADAEDKGVCHHSRFLCILQQSLVGFVCCLPASEPGVAELLKLFCKAGIDDSEFIGFEDVFGSAVLRGCGLFEVW